MQLCAPGLHSSLVGLFCNVSYDSIDLAELPQACACVRVDVNWHHVFFFLISARMRSSGISVEVARCMSALPAPAALRNHRQKKKNGLFCVRHEHSEASRDERSVSRTEQVLIITSF